MYKKIIVSAACSALLVMSSAAADATNGPSVLFDFEDTPLFSSPWVNTFDSADTNGVYHLIGASCDAMVRDPGTAAEWQGGFAFIYGGQSTPGTMTLQDENGSNVWMVLESIQMDTGDDTLTLEGYKEDTLQWTIEAVGGGFTSKPYNTYNTATTGDLSLTVSRIVASHAGPSWDNRWDDMQLYAVEPINTEEEIYGWNVGGWWSPHSVIGTDTPDRLTYPLGEWLYWWSGTNPVSSTITHRPGLEDFPEGTIVGTDPNATTNDITVGGLGSRGVVLGNDARVLVTNEALKVKYDLNLFVGGDEDAQFMDVFFSSTAAPGEGLTPAFMGTTGNELGFVLAQVAGDGFIFTFDPSLASAPDLEVSASDLGLTLANGEGSQDLAVTYIARKTTIDDTWLCNLTISNKVTGWWDTTGDIGVINADVYDNTTRFCVSTPGDLSGGNTTNGLGSLTGYTINNLKAVILLNEEPPTPGYPGYVDGYELTYGEPNTLEGDDYDNDGVSNLEEYAYDGDMTDDQVQGTLPEMVISGDTVSYYHLELKAADSGITYTVETTDNIKDTGFATPVWDDEVVTDHDAFYNLIQNDLTGGDVYFYRTVVTTNAP